MKKIITSLVAIISLVSVAEAQVLNTWTHKYINAETGLPGIDSYSFFTDRGDISYSRFDDGRTTVLLGSPNGNFDYDITEDGTKFVKVVIGSYGLLDDLVNKTEIVFFINNEGNIAYKSGEVGRLIAELLERHGSVRFIAPINGGILDIKVPGRALDQLPFE